MFVTKIKKRIPFWLIFTSTTTRKLCLWALKTASFWIPFFVINRFCKENAFDARKLSTFMSMMNDVFQRDSSMPSRKNNMSESFSYFRSLLTKHSVDRPPSRYFTLSFSLSLSLSETNLSHLLQCSSIFDWRNCTCFWLCNRKVCWYVENLIVKASQQINLS